MEGCERPGLVPAVRISAPGGLRRRSRPADPPRVAAVDWDAFDLANLTHELRDNVGGPDGEKMLWAFEQALGIARVDSELLDYLLVATVCLLAHSSAESPREVLELFFRRSISDREWRERYVALFS